MRGEHIVSKKPLKVSSGSSPHARGALNGIQKGAAIGGSSPHARGAPLTSGAAVAANGIIPACAGSTACPAASF